MTTETTAVGRVLAAEWPSREEFEVALEAAFDEDYREGSFADVPTEYTVRVEWSRMDANGNYRDFTRTRVYRASSVVEATDMAEYDLPASCDAIYSIDVIG